MTARVPDEQIGVCYFWYGQVLVLGTVHDTTTHRHHALQITISLSGHFFLRLPDARVCTGALMIEPDHPHRLSGREGRQAVLLLDPEATVSGNLIDAYRLRGQAAEVDAVRVEPFVQQLESLSRRIPSCVEARRLCDDMLSAILGSAMPFKAIDPRIRDALALLRELPESKGSVRDIAESVGLSEGRFMHLFKEQVGIPVRRYLLWHRLMAALDAVLAGQMLTRAAHETGFADSAHLSRTFREMFGMTLSSCFKNSRFLQVISCLQ